MKRIAILVLCGILAGAAYVGLFSEKGPIRVGFVSTLSKGNYQLGPTGLRGAKLAVEEIKQFCGGRMAGFKKPKIVEFIPAEEMPRTTTGKILHRVLRERYREKYRLD